MTDDPYMELTIINKIINSSQEKKETEILQPENILPQTSITNQSQSGQFEYGYQINLLKQNEDGLMETFLNEQSSEDKPRSEPSDRFNFGFDEEKWRRFLNHSIYMHYERHLMEQATKDKLGINNNPSTTNISNNQIHNNMIDNLNPMRPFIMTPLIRYPIRPYFEMYNQGMYKNINSNNVPK